MSEMWIRITTEGGMEAMNNCEAIGEGKIKDLRRPVDDGGWVCKDLTGRGFWWTWDISGIISNIFYLTISGMTMSGTTTTTACSMAASTTATTTTAAPTTMYNNSPNTLSWMGVRPWHHGCCDLRWDKKIKDKNITKKSTSDWISERIGQNFVWTNLSELKSHVPCPNMYYM